MRARRPKKAKNGRERVQALLDERLNQGPEGGYEALQLLRSQTQRAIKASQWTSAVETSLEGALALIQRGLCDGAVEMALELIQVCDSGSLDYDSSIDWILKVDDAFPSSFKEKRRFEEAALKWSARAPGGFILGAPVLHACLGRAYVATQDPTTVEAAIRHHVLGHKPKELAQYILDRSTSVMQTGVMVMHVVLMFAATENLRDANMFVSEVQAAGGPSSSPFMEFCVLLLKTCEHDAGPLFQELVHNYSSLIGRDSQSDTLIKTIGDKYFGIKPPPNMMSMLMNMLGSG